jgi:arylsulfatase A-like enzyme
MFLLPTTVAIKDKSPNFVVLFMDDNGWGDSSVNMGAAAVHETPNMQKMADEGITFSDFHAGFSVCTASRGALLTGRLAPRTGVGNNFSPESSYGMAREELTIADVLGGYGYESHMIGKWHLGIKEPFHPTYRGFMTYTGLPYSGDMGCIDIDAAGCSESRSSANNSTGIPGAGSPAYNSTGISGAGSPACPEMCPSDSYPSSKDPQTAIPLYGSSNKWDGRNCSGRPCDEEIIYAPFNPNTLNNHYVARAREIFTRYGAGGVSEDIPFFLYVAFAHTHTPMGYDLKWAGTSKREPPPARSSSVYGDTLAEVDGAIGSILDSLDAAGLGNDTLVVLTADNGPADLGVVNCWAIGSPGPFTGEWQKSATGGGGNSNTGVCKATTWEGGHRMVGVMRWSGHIKNPGRKTTAVAQTVDYMTTFAAIAKAKLPSDRVYDGVDLTAVLTNASDDGHVTMFHPRYHIESDTNYIAAMRYMNYKAHFYTGGTSGCINATMQSGGGGGKSMKHDPPLIFDLDNDPSESTPIDPETIPDIVQTVKDAINSFETSCSSTFHSQTNYSTNPLDRPCGNHSSACCRTHAQLQGPGRP